MSDNSDEVIQTIKAPKGEQIEVDPSPSEIKTLEPQNGNCLSITFQIELLKL